MQRRICIGHLQVLCHSMLYEGLEHPLMLVSVRDLEALCLRDEYICITWHGVGHTVRTQETLAISITDYVLLQHWPHLFG